MTKLVGAFILFVMWGCAAMAEESTSAAAPTPDPSTTITLTLGELNLIEEADRTDAVAEEARRAAQPVLDKIKAQIGASRKR